MANLTIQEYQNLTKSKLEQPVVNSEIVQKNNLELYIESRLKLYYLYEKLLGREVTQDTPCTELDWFEWCIKNDADPELKIKK
jgi:hypothetical protein